MQEGDLDIFRLLLDRGADPNTTRTARQGQGSQSALSAALRQSRGTMVGELLANGADPNLCESAAVVAAASAGYIEGMQVLIQHNANIHVQEGVPGMALHAAANGMDVNMVKFLLDKGVDPNSTGGTYGYAFLFR